MESSYYVKWMDEVKLYDFQGNVLNTIALREKVTPIKGKRTAVSEKGIYYKGAGGIYLGHTTNDIIPGVKTLGETGIVYEKYSAVFPKIYKKFGIFAFPHQPVFSDYEGGCGPKEHKILKHVKDFKYSAIAEVLDVIPVAEGGQNIYVYRMKEHLCAESMCIVDLIEYVLKNDYNTAWDKNFQGDITAGCYVRDIADWFVSDSFSHKLGTVYTILRALYENDIYLYMNVIKKLLHANNSEKILIPEYSARIVNMFCEHKFDDIMEMGDTPSKHYRVLIYYLFQGKACCHLEQDEKWDWVRGHFLENLDAYEEKYRKVFGE